MPRNLGQQTSDPCERWPELTGGQVSFRVHPDRGGVVVAVRGPMDLAFTTLALPIPMLLQVIAAITLQISQAMAAPVRAPAPADRAELARHKP